MVGSKFTKAIVSNGQFMDVNGVNLLTSGILCRGRGFVFK
jgi:hypothetical protein